MRYGGTLLVMTMLGTMAGAQPYPHIAPTNAKSPEEELKTFKVPAGFAVQLVAADPDIHKPIQMAFDARGRLWVTTSEEYPFPAVGRPGHDRLYILDEIGTDGKAKKITVFADDLNIPIGVLPLPDGKSAIVSSIEQIPKSEKHQCWIWKLTDTNGDGKADRKEKLYGPFGADDTHGMNNSYTLMPDGWVYACHGFRNDSKPKGKDGHEIHLNSGNTFRFRPDGSRIEVWTRGQVNPFGIAIDPYFNLYTADCHSKPITQLIPGATYSSFAKPHDGLGFAPDMITHSHDSTALCGLDYYTGPIQEWQNVMFLGNVTGNRINCDKIEFTGTTPKAVKQPDFLVSSDLWFRPTEVRFGPDGAMYIADFYNKIIGHYEVPLNEPQRDKRRGRVWRVVKLKSDGTPDHPSPHRLNLATASVDKLVHTLGGPLWESLPAALQLIERGGAEASKMLPESVKDTNTRRAALSLWCLDRLQSVKDGVLIELLQKSAQSNVELKIVALRIARERSTLTEPVALAIAQTMTAEKQSPLVIRAAVEAIQKHPSGTLVRPLRAVQQEVVPSDSHLRHAVRVGLRDQFLNPKTFESVPLSDWKDTDTLAIAEILLAVPSAEASKFLMQHLGTLTIDQGRLPAYVGHAIRHGEAKTTLPELLTLIRKYQASEVNKATQMFLALQRGMQQAGKPLSGDAVTLGEEMALAGLKASDPLSIQAGIDIAGALRSTKLFDPLQEFIARTDRNENQRSAAVLALATGDPAKVIPVLAKRLTLATESMLVRERAAQALGGINSPSASEELIKAFAVVPARLETTIAVALSGTPQHAEQLFKAVEAGKASARVLQEKAVHDRLNAAKVPQWQPRIAALTKGLPSVDQRIVELLKTRAAGFSATKSDATAGKQVFTKHCAICHQINNEGVKIGPQLDGIGGRGLDRLLEDILDPSRNVDQALRTTLVRTKDGKTLSGLALRREGKVLILADDKGKEVRIPEDEIDMQRQSALSPMPANFDQALMEKDFNDLMAYLLSQRPK